MAMSINSPLTPDPNGPMAVGGVAALSPTPAKEAVGQQLRLSPAEYRAEVRNLMNTPGSFAEKSRLLVQLASQQNPEGAKELQAFREKHADKLEELHEKGGWKGLKNTVANDLPKKESYEAFRKEAVEILTKFSVAVVKDMGYEKPGGHAAGGTPGFDSDIDTVYDTKGADIPQAVQVAEKMMFDSVAYHTLGGLSGKMIDTESYLAHPGIESQTSGKMISPMGKAAYTRLELSLSAMQMFRSKGSDPESADWKAYKQAQLLMAEEPDQRMTMAEEPDQRMTLAAIFRDIETFEKSVETDVKKQVLSDYGVPLQADKKITEKEINKAYDRLMKEVNPEGKKEIRQEIEDKAMLSYRMSRLITLSDQIDTDKALLQKNRREIQSLRTNPVGASWPATLGSNISKLLFKSSNEKYIQDLEQRAEKLELSIATKSALRNRFFPEGYLTQGAFNTICINEKGQSQQRKMEKVQSTSQEAYDTRELRQIFYKLNDYENRQASNEEIVGSQQENLSMYTGHFGIPENDEQARKMVVNASKYCDRTMSAGIVLLGRLEEKRVLLDGLEKVVEDPIKNRASQLAEKASELEKCKRKVRFSNAAAKELLGSHLKVLHPEKSTEIDSIVENLLKEREALAEEESLTPTDKLGLFLDYLEAKGLTKVVLIDKDGTPWGAEELETMEKELATMEDSGRERVRSLDLRPAADDAELHTILQGIVGYPVIEKRTLKEGGTQDIPNNPLLEMHGRATQITLEALDLNTKDDIDSFNEDVQDCTNQILTQCFQGGLIQKPVADAAALFDSVCLTSNWKKAA